MVYLDYAASTSMTKTVIASIVDVMENHYGNPSSRHSHGSASQKLLHETRVFLQGTFNADVVFTSGATEANNIGIVGMARSMRRATEGAVGHVVIGATEHRSSVKATLSLSGEGFEVSHMRLNSDMSLDLEHAATVIRKDTILVVQMVRNVSHGIAQHDTL